MSNHSAVSDIILVGFSSLPEAFHGLVSTMMFAAYVISLTANGSVIGLVSFDRHLHQPMYLLIVNLAASDLLYDTVTLPKTIARYWFGDYTIPWRMCMLQIFLVHYFGSMDSYLLAMMAADRYVAICHPLRYPSIITSKMVTILCGVCWILATSTNIVVVILASQIPLCGANKVNSLFCGFTAFAAIACTDVSSSKKMTLTLALVVLLLPLSLILVSYIKIISVISSTRSESVRKPFYTCVTHLVVIALYYTPRLFVYVLSVIPSMAMKPDVNTALLFLYSFVPHMANPIIYFLRTKEIRKTLRRVLQLNKFKVRCLF